MVKNKCLRGETFPAADSIAEHPQDRSFIRGGGVWERSSPKAVAVIKNIDIPKLKQLS